MSEGGVNAAKEVCGKRVQLVLERFPVAKRSRRGWES
jgi:hypothetical protein